MMDQLMGVIADSPIAEKDVQVVQSSPASLRQNVRAFLQQYLTQFMTPVSNCYDLILAEVEAPFLEVVLQYVNQNQSRAARILAMSRGTLRKKMRRYGLLPEQVKKKATTPA